jgi:sigma-B regulation protein RsbU (phosphoserine phosphatase)
MNDLECMEVCGGNGSAENQFARPGLDVSVWSTKALRDTGGSDVHFLSSCASGRITRSLIADVCGHDPVFSELAAELRDLMMQNVNAIKQTRFVREMSVRFHEFSDRGGFATALVCTFFAPTKSLAVCNAGHPPPLVFRAKQNSWSVLKQASSASDCADHLPPGVLGADEYQEFSTRLDDDDMVLSYSNTLTESRKSNGQILGVAGLLDRIKSITANDPSRIVSMLVGSIQEDNPDNLTDGDSTVVLCRATKTGVGFKNNLLAPFRLLGSVCDKTRLE